MRTDRFRPQPRARRRVLLISVVTAVMTLLSGLGLPSVASAAVGVPTTYLSADTYGSSLPPSADKPQSKLWFHDGAW
ncbi:hypothetical protein ACFSHS_14690, partial [Blastococcus deserti]